MKRTSRLEELPLICMVLLATFAPALAQGFEVTPFFGGRIGGGIPVTPFETEGGFFVAGLDLRPSAAYGLALDAGLTENFQLEFLWSRQDSTIRGANAVTDEKVELVDTYVDHYHGNLLYQTGSDDDAMRPFILVGLGVSRFVPGGGFDTQNHFSFGFGGGVKFFFTDNLGLRIQGRWAPTYVGKDEIVLCSVNGCFEADVRRTINQGELTAGLIVRF